MNFSPLWIWLIAGVLLMLMELMTPGFVVFFFGLAAITVAGVMAIFPALSYAWQGALFAVLSVAYLLTLRSVAASIFRGFSGPETKAEADYIGRMGTVTQAINPPVEGRVLIGDLEWTAVAHEPIAVDANVRVVEQKNLTFTVERI